MMIKGVLLVVAVVGVLGAEYAALNKGNVVSELSRVQRSAQQNNYPGFPNFAPPGFDSSHVVSQDTDRNKNGFAQTTIYRNENGMGASSVSVSKSNTSPVKISFSCFMTLLAVLPLVNFFRT